MVELDSEGEMTRSEVAVFLRKFADELVGSPSDRDRDREQRSEEFAGEDSLEPQQVTLIVGGDSATLTVPNSVAFHVEVDSRSPMLGSGVSQEIDFELSWEIEDPDQFDEGGIDVE